MELDVKTDRKVVSISESLNTGRNKGSKKSPSVRIQLILRPDFAERLERLRSDNDASYAEIIRDALRIYEHITELTASGGKLFVKNPDSTLVYIAL